MQKQRLSLCFAVEGDLVHGAWILSVYLRKVDTKCEKQATLARVQSFATLESLLEVLVICYQDKSTLKSFHLIVSVPLTTAEVLMC